MKAKRQWLAFAALFTALALLASLSTLSAQDKAKGEEPEGTPQEIKATQDRESAAERLSTALFLIDFGRANKSPTALLTAVELIHRTPTKEGEEGDKNAAGEKSLSAQMSDLLTEAKKMKADDKEVATLADRLAETIKETPRDVKGPIVNFVLKLDPLDQKTTATYTFQPVGGRITLKGTGGVNRIRLERINAANNLVVETHVATISASLPAITDQFVVPTGQTRKFKFRISNLSTTRESIRVNII